MDMTYLREAMLVLAVIFLSFPLILWRLKRKNKRRG
jgi:hypothetical protein